MTRASPPSPPMLSALQEWFAGIITQPIDDESRLPSLTPSGATIQSEAARYILPSPTLNPAERIEIYSQQYWWRLFGTLHDSFPLTTRLFSYYGFNQQIATPYLTRYPPTHWSLNFLGATLYKWAEEEYKEKDRALVLESILIDWAYNESFFAGELNTKDFLRATKNEDDPSLLEEKVYLQPHLHLFELKHDLFPFRNAMLQEEPEYWMEHDFPPLKKNKSFYYVLYRDHQHLDLLYKEISPYAFRLLSTFKKGSSLIDACQWLENQEDAFITEASEHLHHWFQEWTMHRWLGTR